MQGGGHGPASREFGLGADQVLSAQVVLADGSTVTADACQHSDLYFAIRGGGGGTYGVVTQTTVKAHPNFNVSVQHFAMAPLTTNTSALLDAIAILWEAFPDLNDAGYAGYGTWTIASPTPLFGSFTAGYESGMYMFNSTIAAAQAAFAPTLAKLQSYNGTSLFISVSYVSYPDYWSFYKAESGVEPAVGTAAALGSRLFSRADVQNNPGGLRNMIGVIAGTPSQYTSNNFELVSGGQVFADASDPYSGVNPVWRKSYFNNIVAGGWAPGSSQATINAVWAEINAKVAAMEAQCPDTGAYMNEADRFDPNYAVNFYGTHFVPLSAIKLLYDPLSTFYCKFAHQ